MSKRVDHAGKTYGRATGIEFLRLDKTQNAIWLWLCECGAKFESRGYHVKSGHTNSCGCYNVDRLRKALVTHSIFSDGTEAGDTLHPLYRTWTGMMNRCLNQDTPSYAYYGGRGITIWNPFRHFRRWLEYIEEALGPRPDKHTLDRIDNDGHYAPGNLKWSDRKEQRRNQRRNANALADRIRDAAIADCTGTVERG